MLGTSGKAGGYNAPGLPNITGSEAFRHPDYGMFVGGTNSGALSGIVGASPQSARASAYTNYDTPMDVLYFDSSKSNPIYGNSNTVQPPSIDLPVIFYLGRRGK